MSSAVAAAFHSSNAHKPIRVMVVDDAVVVRGLLARWVDAEPDMEITAVLRTGREAVDQVERANPDVVLLDVDMPELDGISALPLLLQKKRDLVVIMASTLTRRNAEISLRALALGAADYIPKPETTREVTNSASFRRELVEKIRHLGRRHRTLAPERRPVIAPAESKLRPPSSPSPAPSHVLPAGGLHLRPFAATAPRVLLIGSSTGGPQALSKLVGQLGSADRSRAGADYPAHATDLHHCFRRAACSRKRTQRARSRARRSRRRRKALSRAGRPTHARCAP